MPATTSVGGSGQGCGRACISLHLIAYLLVLLVQGNYTCRRRDGTLKGEMVDLVGSYDMHSIVASWSVQEASVEMNF